MEKMTQEMAVSSQEAYLLSIMQSLWKNRCIAVIIGLKIPEILCNSEEPSISIEEIAAKSDCKTSNQLYAVMRLLAQWGIGKELENKHFAKNESIELLRRDKGSNLGHLFGYYCGEEMYTGMRSLGACVKEGKPSFMLEHGMDHYTYMSDLGKRYDQAKMFEGLSEHKIGSDDRRREFAENYSHAMGYISSLLTLPGKAGVKNVYNVYPWSTCHKLVDIGGSFGGFLASVLKLPGCEHIQGYVLDLPDVVDKAKSKIQDLGIPGRRIEFVKYDFTKPFPSDLDLQCDTILCKNTLTQFINDKSLMSKFLSDARKLFSSKGGRLVIIEPVTPEDKDDKVGINGIELGALSIFWMNIGGTSQLTKREWVERIQAIGEELGYQVKKCYDTFAGGQVIFEISYKPNNQTFDKNDF